MLQNQKAMNHFVINTHTNIAPASGRLLIAEPFMRDPDFVRSVVYLCNHDDNSSLGFSINTPITETLADFFPELSHLTWPIYIGGPVENNTLFVLHTLPKLLGGDLVENGIFLGANFEELLYRLKNNEIRSHQIKFLLGYSGWGPGQLQAELLEESWLVAPASVDLVLSHQANEIYKKSLEPLGDEFSTIALLPKHPSLN